MENSNKYWLIILVVVVILIILFRKQIMKSLGMNNSSTNTTIYSAVVGSIGGHSSFPIPTSTNIPVNYSTISPTINIPPQTKGFSLTSCKQQVIQNGVTYNISSVGQSGNVYYANLITPFISGQQQNSSSMTISKNDFNFFKTNC